MTISEMGSIGEALSGAAVLFSLVYLIVEVRRNPKCLFLLVPEFGSWRRNSISIPMASLNRLTQCQRKASWTSGLNQET